MATEQQLFSSEEEVRRYFFTEFRPGEILAGRTMTAAEQEAAGAAGETYEASTMDGAHPTAVKMLARNAREHPRRVMQRAGIPPEQARFYGPWDTPRLVVAKAESGFRLQILLEGVGVIREG